MTPDEIKGFLSEAISISLDNVKSGNGGPFGAVVVKNGEIIARGKNSVTSLNDPTAHAEVMAIRQACEALNSFQLVDCYLFTSCEPCPMCLGAIYWARPEKVFFCNTKQDAASIGFDDDFIYKEIVLAPGERKIPMVHVKDEKGLEAFNSWAASNIKVSY